MICVLSVMSLLLGAALACAATHVPSQIKLLESSGGTLMIAGLALIGSGLPILR
jgi:hypothetical protein